MKIDDNLEMAEVIRPIISLINKSEKAQQKLVPGTWQYTMLRDNVKALRVALVLINGMKGDIDNFSREDYLESLRSIGSMINRSEKAQVKFSPGTSQYSLQQNRIKALNHASDVISNALNVPKGI